MKDVTGLTWEQADKLAWFGRWRWKRARKNQEYWAYICGGPWNRLKKENETMGVWRRGWTAPR